MPVTTPNLASELPANGNGIHQSTLKTDRRRRARFCLHWTARLLTSDQGWVEASILNISSDGFYCLSEIDLPVGAIMRCVIAGPAIAACKACNVISMECTIKVIHSTPAEPEGVYGAGCQIKEYKFSSHAARAGH